MARVSATASLGMRIGLAHKKGFKSHDAATPHHSFTIERNYPDELTDEQLEERANHLHAQAFKLCESKIQAEAHDLLRSDN